jgi:hypothetical protein
MTKPMLNALMDRGSLKDFSTQDLYREILTRIGEDP